MSNTCSFGRKKDGGFSSICINGTVVVDSKKNIKGRSATVTDLRVRSDAVVCGDLTVKSQTNRIHQSKPLTADDRTRRATNAPTEAQQYDIIVCGAGTAGSLLIYRLAERYPNAKILVLDIGKDDVRDTTSTPNPNDASDDWGQLLRGLFSGFGEGAHAVHGELTTRNSDEKFRSKIHDPLGETLGGTSSTNYLIWNRGSKKGTYDRWEEEVGDEFGFDSMNESYIVLENRTQNTSIYGTQVPMWLTSGAPNPGRALDTSYHGTTGRMALTQFFGEGAFAKSVTETLQDSPLPNRDAVIPVYLDPEDPSNPDEYSHYFISTEYDQSGNTFASINPYPVTTPGYTYTPPNDGSNAKGPEYAGFPSVVRTPFGGAIDRKFLSARCYGAPAWLYPIIDDEIPHNVTIKTNAYVTKLLFTNPDDPLECTGVEWVEDGWQVSNAVRSIDRSGPQYNGTISDISRANVSLKDAVNNQANVTSEQAFATSDVWLCMGAVGNPRVLQLSGIGEKKHLESLRRGPKIDIRLDLPGVGNGVQDTLDMGIGFLQEVDGHTDFPAPLPAGVSPTFWGIFQGIADPTNPLDPLGTASIQGANYDKGPILRIKTDPSKNYHDMDIVTLFGDVAHGVGNYLYQDIVDIIAGNQLDITMSEGHPAWDRYKWGFNVPDQTISVLHTHGFLCEYWNLQGQGEVKINSGNPYDLATYAPAMGTNETDIDAMVNAFRDTIIPICKRLAKKQWGHRGLGTYQGVATAGGAATITLGAALVPTRAFDSTEIITQGTYDTAGSLAGYVVSIVAGTGAGQNNVITAWGGSGGGYVADVLPWSVVPDNTSVYFLNPPGALATDPVKYSGDNYRNFARFVKPNGDNFLSAYHVETITDPFDTVAYVAPLAPGLPPVDPATRITVNQSSHGLSVGDFVKFSGVTGTVDGIDAIHFNDYHIVDEIVDSDTYEILLFWNRTPTGGPGSSIIDSPAASASGASGVGGDVTIEKMTFNELKFRKWLERTYFSGWHKCCSCKMGLPDDESAVVDTRARVYDVKGLRITDASIFPVKPNANTQAPAYGITQRLFEMISVEEYDNFLN